MARNDAATPSHVCPQLGAHAIDIVQPPGIGVAPIADIDARQTIVAAALARNSSAETPNKARREARSPERRASMSRAAAHWGWSVGNVASVIGLRSDSGGAQGALDRRRQSPLGLSPVSYSSWRRSQGPLSLRPFGARSSHGYMLQTPSTPRA